MTLDAILAFSVFAFVTSVTPGPNNIMLLASGVNFGFRASIPHIFGISGGFLLLVVAVGVGLAEIFGRYPLAYDLLKWVGASYLLYLAWRIAGAAAPERKSVGNATPLSFWGAAAFQWVNPKAWLMAVGGISAYVPASSGFTGIVGAAALFAAINAPSVGLWAVCGSHLQKYLQVPAYRRAFNLAMAGLLVASLGPLLAAALPEGGA